MRAYDVFISHRSEDITWVECLAENLRVHDVEVFLDKWEMRAGPILDQVALALENSRAGLVVATPQAVQSGWVQAEYRKMWHLSIRNPCFRVIPLIFGDVPDLPLVETINCVDFRDPSPQAYRSAFKRLVQSLKGDEFIFRASDLAYPPDLLGAEAQTSKKPIPSDQRVLERIFNRSWVNPITILLSQSYRNQSYVISEIQRRMLRELGSDSIFHVAPPFSVEADVHQYFSALGEQCNFGKAKILTSIDFELALDRRVRDGQSTFLLVTGFENGSKSCRQELAGIIRAIADKYGDRLRVLLCGGEKLAALKYQIGTLSLLNMAEEIRWPELELEDIFLWWGPGETELDPGEASGLLDLCGGHPRLIRYCLEQRRGRPDDRPCDFEKLLREDPFIWYLFFRFGKDDVVRAEVCSLLGLSDLGGHTPWPDEKLIRKLYWENLLKVNEDGRYVWRSSLIQQIGQEVLRCE